MSKPPRVMLDWTAKPRGSVSSDRKHKLWGIPDREDDSPGRWSHLLASSWVGSGSGQPLGLKP